MQVSTSQYKVIEPLGYGYYHEISLGRKPDSDALFLLKALKQPRGSDSQYLNQKRRFKKEIDFISSLNHKNIAKLHDSLSDGRNFTLVYPYYAGKTLAAIFEEGGGFSARDSLSLVLQLVDALEYIHSRGIIHCDINPNNLFFTEDKDLQLFDFGVSLTVDEALKLPEGLIVGTLPYVAPEQLGLTDFKIDTRTDLFCAAIILYRLLSGTLPFPVRENTIEELSNIILKTEIKPVARIPATLNSILLKALKPTPEERYQTATGFKLDLQFALGELEGEHRDFFFAGEKDSIIAVNREKIFVGRDEELHILKKGLRSLKKKRPSSFLIHGPSGIGKTEIVSRFADRVDPETTFFLASRCNRFTPNQPYSVYRELILHFLEKFAAAPRDWKNDLVEKLHTGAAEFSGIIVKAVPECRVLFREVREAGEVEQSREADRLIHALSQLLLALSAHARTVMFIDDFQWIDQPSYQIVKQLLSAKTALMLVFNFRHNEYGDDLYVGRENVRAIGIDTFLPVTPLSIKDVSEFVASRLGEIENNDVLAENLYQKTDGHPFVLNESMRHLVNNAILKYNLNGWYFSREDLEALPRKFNPVSLVLNKFEGLSGDQKYFLQLASLVEGKFDRDIIMRLGGFDREQAEGLSRTLETAGFISRRFEEKFSFIHSQIQESIFSSIPKEKKFALFEKLGSIYEQDATREPERVFSTAECFLKSKNLEKSISLCERAANYAIEKLAFDLAIKYLKLTHLMLSQGSRIGIETTLDPLAVQLSLGNVLMLTGSNKEALNVYLRILERPELDRDSTLEVKYRIGSIYHNMGEFKDSIHYFMQALKELDFTFPKNRAVLIIQLVFEIIKQVLISYGAKYILKKNSYHLIHLKVRILNKLTYSLYFQDMYIALYSHLKALNIADFLNDSYEKVETYSLHSVPSFQMLLKKRAFKYLDQSIHISKSIKRKDILSFAECFGGIIYFYDAKWKKAETMLRSSIENYKSVGDLWGQVTPIEHLGYIYFSRGDFVKAREIMNREHEISFRCNDQRGSFLANRLHAFIHFIESNDSPALWDSLRDYQEKFKDSLTKTMADIFFLKKEILSGNLNRALHLSGTILKTIRDKSLNYEYIASAFSDHCELLILEKHSRLQGVRNIEKSDPLLTKELFRYCLKSFLYGKIYPAHLGAAYRSFAWYFAFTRRRRLAKYFFKKAIHRHHSLDMRYEEAKSLRDYALFLDERHLPGEARDYYNRAFQKFENAGAVLESERLQDKVDPDLVKAPFNQAPSIYDTYDSGISFSSDIDYMRVNTLFEVSSLMSRMDDMNALLPQILLALIKATGAQHGGLFLDEDNPYSEQTFLMNFDGKPLSPEQMVISEDILEWVKANQKIMLVKDGVKDPRIRASAEKHRIRSVLCVPLLREDEYIGCAYLSNDRISNLFTQGAEKAAYILSTQAGILLENAYLMDSYKKLNTRLERQVKEQTNDIRKKNKQLEAFNVRLIESERMKSLLTGTLVHDIKNHASGIFQNIKVLARKFKEQPRVQKNLGMMADSCNDIVGLSSNLLDIGKMEEGKLEVTRRSVTYAEIRKIIDKFTHGVIFEEKGIRVNVIPPAGKFEIEADLYLLQRVLQNLFSNASKYTEQRGEVIISFETGDRENIISIFNSGPPIPEGMKESLFDKYSRLGDKRSVFSKGLGLYFCRMVMHAHGGKIWVDTDAHGNSFKISFINRPKADIKQNDSDIPKIVSHDLSKEEETP